MDYINQPTLTYLGNKRKLISQIDEIVKELNPSKTMDLFCGSSIVARALTKHSTEVHANDIEEYAYTIAKCSIETPTPEDQTLIAEYIRQANQIADNGPWVKGIITQHYAPADTEHINPGERCFFTRENAIRIDTIRAYIDVVVPEHLRPYILAPLLIKCSQNTNTSGHFQAFHKNRDGVGQWGGHYKASLARIKGPITLECPVWTECTGRAHKRDAIECLEQFPDGYFDVVYCDPPYNARQYSYLYFLLNIIANNHMPTKVSEGGATDPSERNDSMYCRKAKVKNEFERLIATCVKKSKYTILSYNNEGLVRDQEFEDILRPYKVTRYDFDHKRYNVRGDEDETTSKKTKETMYLITSGCGMYDTYPHLSEQ
jgi:adenine-specific DNA-methyltransferase